MVQPFAAVEALAAASVARLTAVRRRLVTAAPVPSRRPPSVPGIVLRRVVCSAALRRIRVGAVRCRFRRRCGIGSITLISAVWSRYGEWGTVGRVGLGGLGRGVRTLKVDLWTYRTGEVSSLRQGLRGGASGGVEGDCVVRLSIGALHEGREGGLATESRRGGRDALGGGRGRRRVW